MKNRKNLLMIVVLLFGVVGMYFNSQAFCENKIGEYEGVGIPPSFADLVEKIKPAVVNISTITTVTVPGNPFRQFFGPDEEAPFGEFFKRFFGDIPDKELKQQSLGSGFIVDKDGYIITNNHVVEGADEIKVKLADEREFKAKVIGRDPKTDLAIIKISSLFKNSSYLSLGDSDKMRVGDWVLAIGNPFGLGHTVTQGIISATGRVIGAGPYDDFIQIDAPINPGNSGGPLVNLKGEVIGVNTAIVATGQGIGFTIPSNIAKSVFSQLKDKGKVMRGWIGVSVQSVTPEIANAFGLKEPKGALVGDVAPGSPADSAGIKSGDIIISFDGKTIKNANDLPMLVAVTPVGKAVGIKVIRDGKEINFKITVEELSEERLTSQQPRIGTQEKTLGMEVDDIKPEWRKEFDIKYKDGVVVIDVTPDSLADEAGMQPGDVIKEINRHPIKNTKEYKNVMSKIKKGSPILFLLKRGNETFYVTILVS